MKLYPQYHFASFSKKVASAAAIAAFMLVFAAVSAAALPTPAALAATPASNSSAGSNLSYNWAGYVSDNGTYTAVTASWVIPSASASQSTSADATWVGIGGVDSTDLIQVGTQAVFSNGGVAYQAWYETLPNASVALPVTIRPGDSISASLQQVSSGVWQVSLQDSSTGQNASVTVDYNSSLSSAEWIEEMPTLNSQFLPLDNFGAVTFTNGFATVNGTEENILNANAGSLDMINNSNQALATVSALGTDGASFSVTRTSASAAGSAISSSSNPSSGTPYSVTYRITWQNGSTTRTSVGVRGLQRFHSFGGRAQQPTTQYFSANGFLGSKLFLRFFQSYNRGIIRG